MGAFVCVVRSIASQEDRPTVEVYLRMDLEIVWQLV